MRFFRFSVLLLASLVACQAPTPVEGFVLVEGGSFNMGCSTKQIAAGCDPTLSNGPVVQITDFFLATTTVTNEQFLAFLQEKGNQKVAGFLWYNPRKEVNWIQETEPGVFAISQARFRKHPVTGVNYYGALAYCDWLGEQLGLDIRLPSASEWEFAAKGGVKSQNFLYAGSDTIRTVAWYQGHLYEGSGTIPPPAGALRPNELGLHDMSGGVYEWTNDCYPIPSLQDLPKDGAPYQSEPCLSRALMGASFQRPADDCLTGAGWVGAASDTGHSNAGFRVAYSR